jgi:hypothetical protein
MPSPSGARHCLGTVRQLALPGVRYVIGPPVLVWGVVVPMMIFFLGPLYPREMAGPNPGEPDRLAEPRTLRA